MKIFNFHLMPYAAADMDAIREHGTSWVTFSNSHYDPKKGAKLYHEYLDQLERADELGFDGVLVNEHHQTAYGLMPTPGVLAGALARKVKRGKLAVLGRALPLLENPLSVAEEFAILDNLMEGRFVAGFVRGIGAEYHNTGMNPTESNARFTEAHDLIIRAWTEPGPFEFYGKYYKFNTVNVWPRPYQEPHPGIFIPTSGSESSIRWIAQKRYTVAQTLAPIDVVARTFKQFRQEADKAGYQASSDQLGWSNSIYIGDTDEKAVREVRIHLENYVSGFLSTDPTFMSPPGYSSIESLMRARAKVGQRFTVDELIQKGVVLVGSPETVRQKLAEYQDLAGFNNIFTKTQMGTMPHDMAMENQDAVAKEILPYFRDRLPQTKGAAA